MAQQIASESAARFQVGRTYQHYIGTSDDIGTVTIAGRTANKVELSDGRTVKVVMGTAATGLPHINGLVEVLRLDCDGVVARGGVVSAYNATEAAQ